MATGTRKCVVLLSGGIDSATTLAWALDRGFEPYALTFRYGQRHQAEVMAARRVANFFNVRQHKQVDIDLRLFGGSALTDAIDVPKERSIAEMGEGIPVTYVPARNTIFLSFAIAWAETLGAEDIALGVNALDYAGYPDCRPEYIRAYETMANLATKAGVEGMQSLTIHTPLIDKTKAQIIEFGIQHGADYSLTSTCYDPAANGDACGRCDACTLRLSGFAEVGASDPITYCAGEGTRA